MIWAIAIGGLVAFGAVAYAVVVIAFAFLDEYQIRMRGRDR